MSDYPKLNKDQLQSIVAAEPILHNLFTMLSEQYQTNRSEITLKNMAKYMGIRGLYSEATNRPLWKALDKLEKCNCGKRIKGSRSNVTRFKFFYDMLDLAEIALYPANRDPEDLYRDVQDETSPEPTVHTDTVDDNDWCNHSLLLRRHYDFNIELPFKFTEAQARRLSDLINSAVLSEDEEPDEFSADELDLTFYLNAQTSIDIALPADLTPFESSRLSCFCHSLATVDEFSELDDCLN